MNVERLLNINSFFITVLFLLELSTAWAMTTGRLEHQTVPAPRFGRQSPSAETLNILFVRGLPDPVRKEVSQAISENFNKLHVQQIDATEAKGRSYQWPDVDMIVASGRPGCEVALEADVSTTTLCTLLTKESFSGLNKITQAYSSRKIDALVIDQPVARQAQVASTVYPALNLFTSFHASSTEKPPISNSGHHLKFISFSPDIALSKQLREGIKNRDALVAISDSTIFNTSTLSTVLLTAYGFGKPVIGFSRAYVRAGALITCYSTPTMIMRQVAEDITSGASSDSATTTLSYPRFFAILDNASVARSLSLIKGFRFSAEQTYQDTDFDL